MEVRVIANAPVLRGEVLGGPTEFAQLALDAVQELFHVTALKGRLRRADVVENRAVDVEEVFLLGDVVAVLEERPHHPGMGQGDLQAFDRLLGCHGVAVPGLGVGGFGAGADSASSFE